MKRLSSFLFLLGACGPVAASAPAGNSTTTASTPQGSDADFQALAGAIGARMSATVRAWGTAAIADDGQPHRYAVLRATGDGELGAYLFEVSPGQDWLIRFEDDGRTDAWQTGNDEGDESAPVWEDGGGSSVTHEQTHHHGYDKVEFDFEGGVPTAVSVESLDDAAESDEPVTDDYRGKHVKLSDVATEMQVTGPAATADALTADVH